MLNEYRNRRGIHRVNEQLQEGYAMSEHQIAREVGISRERVVQLERAGVRKLWRMTLKGFNGRLRT